MNTKNNLNTKENLNSFEVCISKRRCNNSIIDNELNVECYNVNSSHKYLSDAGISPVICPKGSVDMYHCGTGKGKTTYILNEIAKEAEAQHKNVLMLVHRKSILEQTLNDIIKKGSECSANVNGICTFGNITITTYQKLHNEFATLKANGTFYSKPFLFGTKYDVVCGDEIHFIQDDALFSQAANDIADDIFSFFKRDVSYAFFSATIDSVERVLYTKICNKLLPYSISCSPLQTPMRSIHKVKEPIRKIYMTNTYENYHVSYMSEINEVVRLYNSLLERQKLLIFVSSKEEGEFLHKQLKDSVFIFAESGDERRDKQADEVYKKVIHNDRFDCKCLITTKVLDAGVNLHMDDLSDIVIATEDGKSEFLQIAGRKRNPNGAQVRLYILARSMDYFTKKLYYCKKKLQILSSIDYCKRCNEKHENKSCDFCKNSVYNNISFESLQGILKLQGDKLVINEMAKRRLETIADDYEDIIEKFKTIGSSAFLQEQLSWLGLKDQYNDNYYYNENNIPKSSNDLVLFLESKLDILLDTKELQIEFRKDFEEIAISMECYNKNQKNLIGLKKINELLAHKGIPFLVNSKQIKSRTTWTIERYIRDSNECNTIDVNKN